MFSGLPAFGMGMSALGAMAAFAAAPFVPQEHRAALARRLGAFVQRLAQLRQSEAALVDWVFNRPLHAQPVSIIFETRPGIVLVRMVVALQRHVPVESFRDAEYTRGDGVKRGTPKRNGNGRSHR
jgi:hypothetical protein